MNFNTAVGQAACRLYSSHTQGTLPAGLGQFGAAVSAMVVANVLCESTVENYYHAGVRPRCRKLVELQKAKAASHAAWSSVKCDEATDVIVKGTWHAD